MKPAIQVKDSSAASGCLRELGSANIKSQCIPIASCAKPLPTWIDEKAGGFLLLVEEGKFEKAMDIIGKEMGYSG
jgi:hypothetical protein